MNLVNGIKHYADLSSREVGELDKQNTVVVLLAGATEQHGPHLPLSVDSDIGWAVLQGAAGLVKDDVSVLLLPRLDFGKSNEHLKFPGTLSLSAQTLNLLLRDIAESVANSGFTKLVILSSHGGHNDIISTVATDSHIAFPSLRVFPLFLWEFQNVLPPAVDPIEARFGIHAGQIETSLMLYLRENAVRMDKAIRDLPPAEDLSHFALAGGWKFSWSTEELSQTGVMGDATRATRETGEWIYNALTNSLAGYLREVSKFALPSMKTLPPQRKY